MTSDYNNQKGLKTASKGGATVSKAFPVEVVGGDLVRDGFEDGDLSSNPQWTQTVNQNSSNTITVDQNQPKNGSYSVHANTAGAGNGDQFQYRAPTWNSSNLQDGMRFSAWMRLGGSVGDTTTIILQNGTNFGDGAAVIGLNAMGNGGVTIYEDGSAEELIVDSISADTWYRCELEVFSDGVIGRVYDSNDNLIGQSDKLTTATSYSFDRMKFRGQDKDTTSRDIYWDDITYDITLADNGDDSKTGDGFVEIDWTNIDTSTVSAAREDIAFYDTNGNLLPYEIESIDINNQRLKAHVYNDWTLDGTRQAYIAYGDNSANTDRSDAAGTWSSHGAEMVQHHEDDPLSATDSTSNDNDGSVTGSVYTEAGVLNGGGSHNGSDDVITVPGGTQFNSTSPVTMICFMKTDTGGSNPRRMLSYQESSGEFNGYYVDLSDGVGGTSGGARANFRSSATSAQLTDSSRIDDNRVHMVAAQYDPSTGNGRLVVDGASVDTFTNTGQGAEPAADFGIAGRDDNSNNFEGMIDEVIFVQGYESLDYFDALVDATIVGNYTLLSQEAGESTSTTDTAVDTQFRFTPQASTEAVTRRDVATDTSFSFTPTTAEAFEDLTEFLNVANRAETKLTSSITAEDRTIEVDDASVFPNPPFLVSIEASNSREIVKVNGNGTNTLDECFRGREDTTAQDWDAGVTVSNRWTKGTYDRLVEELNESTQVISAHQSTAQGDVDAGVVANVFENIEIQEAPYQVLSDSKIRIDETGQYEISYNVNFTQTGGSDREIMQGNIRVNGTDQTPETRSTCYIRNDASGDKNSVSNDHVLSLSVGDEVELFVEEQKGGVQTEVTSANISIKKVA